MGCTEAPHADLRDHILATTGTDETTLQTAITNDDAAIDDGLTQGGRAG
jgi:hypothetical protein